MGARLVGRSAGYILAAPFPSPLTRAFRRMRSGWIPTRSATPSTALVPQRKVGFPFRTPPSARFPGDKDGSARRNIEPLQRRRGLHFAPELRQSAYQILEIKVSSATVQETHVNPIGIVPRMPEHRLLSCRAPSETGC
jgi:hypothetical protein